MLKIQELQKNFYLTIILIKNNKLLYEHNKFEQIPKIINLLKEEKKIALVSDAGMPCISDPGYELVDEALKII